MGYLSGWDCGKLCNGCHSRLMADLIVTLLFNCPAGEAMSETREFTRKAARDRYVEALHAADAGNFGLLIAFARS